MSLLQFMAGQARKQSGFVGRVLGRMLNKLSADMNRRSLALMELVPEDQVLEVGFGGGGLIALMLPIITRGRIAGVDFSPDMVRVCGKRFEAHIQAGRVELCCANVFQLPYAAGEFTKICSVNTIYFWSDPMAALAELRRVLRPGGTLVVCFNPRATASKMPFTRHGFFLYEGPEVRQLLEEAGFRNVQMVCARHRIGEFQVTTGIR